MVIQPPAPVEVEASEKAEWVVPGVAKLEEKNSDPSFVDNMNFHISSSRRTELLMGMLGYLYGELVASLRVMRRASRMLKRKGLPYGMTLAKLWSTPERIQKSL
jgi:hypothetical protein